MVGMVAARKGFNGATGTVLPFAQSGSPWA
jgi:hypothetical protein